MNSSLPQFLQQTLQNDVVRWFFFGPLLLILLDLITGIAAAARTGKFALKEVSAFFGKDIMRYLGATGVVVLVYFFGGIAQATAIASALGMGTLALSIGDSIRANWQEITGDKIALPPQADKALSDVEKLASQPAQITPANQPITTQSLEQALPGILKPQLSLPSKVAASPSARRVSSFLSGTTPAPATDTSSASVASSVQTAPLPIPGIGLTQGMKPRTLGTGSPSLSSRPPLSDAAMNMLSQGGTQAINLLTTPVVESNPTSQPPMQFPGNL